MSPTRMYVGAFVEEMRDDSIMSYCQMDLLGVVEPCGWTQATEARLLKGMSCSWTDCSSHTFSFPLFFFLAAIR